METWPGVGERIAKLMREKGYWNPKRDKADVLRFSMDHRYIPQFVYKWLYDGVVPSRENLDRLAKDLGASAPWILFGDEVNRVPGKPRKRGGRKVVGLVLGVALGVGTPTGWEPARLIHENTATGSTPTTDNMRGIMSRWRRRIYHPWWHSPTSSTSGSLVLTVEPA